MGQKMRRRRFLSLFLTVACGAAVSTFGGQEFKFPLTPESVRFAAIGDMGTGDAAQYQTAQKLIDSHVPFPYDFVIMLGDNIYGGSKSKDFEQKFEVPYKPLLDAGIKFYACLGNHDNPNERLYKPFNMDGASYYTYKKGNVRFFVLDSNYMDPKQLAWLESELKSAGSSDWKICYFHHPLYSSGRFHGPATDLRQVLEPLFMKYGVNVVFAGHEHVYERVHPQHGIYYFTEGASGELRPNNLNKTAITDKGFDTDRSFMLVEIAADDMHFETLSRSGQTVDSGIIHKQPAASAQKITQPSRPAQDSVGSRVASPQF
jgi:3',5'-cyclic AMP phosphodiesterase CpdA